MTNHEQGMEPAKALEKCMYLCSQREYCKMDIRQKLASWGIAHEEADEILGALEKERFIDEKRYSGFFVNDKARFNKWGLVKIAYALKTKGIPESVFQEFIENIDMDWYKKVMKEEMAKKLQAIQKKEQDPYKIKAKLMQFGQSRGYEADLIFEYLGEAGM
jgi:regulatory protein